MAKSKKNAETNRKPAPRSAEVARVGITTGGDFANLMSALMADLIDGRVTPQIGNAACNAAGKLLKVVELQQKYGTSGENGSRVLKLAMNTQLVGSGVEQ